MDYLKNVGKTATMAKQINSILSGNFQEEFEEIPNQEEMIIRDVLDSLKPELKMDEPDARLKQVLMPDGEGNDLCLTPLHSGGLSATVNSTITTYFDKVTENENKDRRKIGRAEMSFGGANPQNVGGMVRDMRKPLLFIPPREDTQAKKAYSIYYKGIEFLPGMAIDDFLDWWDSNRDKKETMEERRDKDERIRQITRLALDSGQEAMEFLEENRQYLPGESLLDPELMKANPVMAGLAIKDKRDKQWREQFSEHLSRAILDRKRRRRDQNGKWQTVKPKMSGQEARDLRPIIESETLA